MTFKIRKLDFRFLSTPELVLSFILAKRIFVFNILGFGIKCYYNELGNGRA